jgi:Peptidase family C25
VGRLPVITAMTCTISRFAVPGTSSLGEDLVRGGTGGAIAVWGPSGLADNAQSLLLAEHFYRSTSVQPPPALGDRILQALKEFRDLGGDGALLHTYNLLGDPALRLPQAPTQPATGGSSGE